MPIASASNDAVVATAAIRIAIAIGGAGAVSDSGISDSDRRAIRWRALAFPESCDGDNIGG